MENGNVISLRPEVGTLVIPHEKPTSPMAKVGRSAAAEVMSRRAFFNMLMKSVGGNLTTRLGCLRVRSGESRCYIDLR